MAAWSIIWTYVLDCGTLCGTLEAAVKQLDHHLLAAAIYSGIITVVTVTVVRKEYFDKLFYKLRAHGINTNGAKNVWRFTLAIFLFNATLHVVEILLTDTDHNFLEYAPWAKLSWLTVFRIMYWVGNTGLWLWAAMLYKGDAAAEFILMSMRAESYSGADKDALFKKRKSLLVAYFTPAILLFAFDDTLSKNWDFFRITGVLHSLVDDYLKLWQGWPVLITLIVFNLTAAAMIVVTMFYQEKVRNIGWKMLVYSVPRAVPIVSTLIVGTAAVVFLSLSGSGRDGSISDDIFPTQRETAARDSPLVRDAPRSPAPEQITPTKSETAARDSPLVRDAPRSPAPVQITPTQNETAARDLPDAPGSPAPEQITPTRSETVARDSPPVPGAAPAPLTPLRQRSTSPSKVALGANPLNAGGGSSGYNETLRPQ
jgi:hypothetical protein